MNYCAGIYDAFIMTMKYLGAVLPVMCAGVFIMNILQNSGYLAKITWITDPLVKFGHLSEPVGLTFLTAFGSPSASNAMLKKLYDSNTLSRKELNLAVLINAFPVMVMETRTLLPTMISFLSFTGALLFGILICFRFIQTMIILVISRFLLDEKKKNFHYDVNTNNILRGRALLIKSITDTVPPLKRIILISAPVTFITMLLVKYGMFDGITLYIKGLAGFFPVPVEGLGVVAAYFGHYIAGYSLAGSLLSQKILTVKEIILTLLTAQVLSSVIFTLRHSAHYYIGIFGSRLGVQILSLNLLVRNSVNISGIVLLFYLWR